VTLASSGLTPAPTQYVRIISGDKHVYIVERRIAMVSGLIRTMLSNCAFRLRAAGLGGGGAGGGLVGRAVDTPTQTHKHTRNNDARTQVHSAAAFKETGGELDFPEIPAATLEKVIEYFHYKVRGCGVVVLLTPCHR